MLMLILVIICGLTCEPYECQESHQLIVEGKYLNPVKRAPKRYTTSDLFDKHFVNHIVHAAVAMDPISEDNQLPHGCLRTIAFQNRS